MTKHSKDTITQPDGSPFESISSKYGYGKNRDWLDRGYRSHMHLQFNLVNMNGRLYDPILGRMLSPDPFVADATGTQGLNKYSYALNSPLKYTDPTGWWNIGGGSDKAQAINDLASKLSRESYERTEATYSHMYVQEMLNLKEDRTKEQLYQRLITEFPSIVLNDNLSYRINFTSNKVYDGLGSRTITTPECSDICLSTLRHSEIWPTYTRIYEVQYRSTAQSSGGTWDINGDGKFQKNEADNWWLNGGGKPVNVNNANIDWTGVKIPKGAAKGSIFAISTTDAFLKLPYETAATYGGTSFKVVSTMHVQVLDQLYHYNMRPNNSIENRIRNYLTEQGRPNGTGTDFMIHYYNPIILIK
jgi:RHS repeat-associated protein